MLTRADVPLHRTCALLLLAVAACAGPTSEPPSGSSEPRPAPEQITEAELPAGHPPLSSTPSAETLIAPPPPGSGTGAAGLTWTAPTDWISETPSSSMRRAQYRVPGPGGDGELVVFYFGPGQGGDAMSNAIRWANQFAQPDGRPAQEVMKTEQIRIGEISVLLTEVTGTYSGGMTMMTGTSEELADHMLLGAVAEGADANWFFKLTGPTATLEPQRSGFRAMIESLRQGG